MVSVNYDQYWKLIPNLELLSLTNPKSSLQNPRPFWRYWVWVKETFWSKRNAFLVIITYSEESAILTFFVINMINFSILEERVTFYEVEYSRFSEGKQNQLYLFISTYRHVNSKYIHNKNPYMIKIKYHVCITRIYVILSA